MSARPILARDDKPAAVDDFVAGLQAAIDAADADGFNAAFATDVLWGSPFGLVVDGYDQIHPVHKRMFDAAAERRRAEGGSDGGSRYEVEHARQVSDDVALAFVRRLSLAAADTDTGDQDGPQAGRPEGFDELALFVLVRRDGAWWLAAGLHTPDRRKEAYG